MLAEVTKNVEILCALRPVVEVRLIPFMVHFAFCFYFLFYILCEEPLKTLGMTFDVCVA